MEDRCIPMKEVCRLTSLAKATIDRYRTPEYAHMGFPERRKIGHCRFCFWLSEVMEWLKNRPKR